MVDSEKPAPKFRVITGDWLEGEKWLELPQTVHARPPEDRLAFCRVRVSRRDILKAAGARRRQPAYEFWSVIAGRAPPVPHLIENPDSGLTMLSMAVACFQGIKRPSAEDDDGARILAYVLKPNWFYEYSFLPPAVICNKVPVPADLVFVAYVKLDEPADGPTRGVLTHWHFVDADPGNAHLPVDFADRYDNRHW